MKELHIRVYYEDTDHGGVVYHANYLKFMERARTEGLRELGFEQSKLAEQDDILFAVSRTDVHYRRPAVFDDMLVVITNLVEVKGARMNFKQKIVRDHELLVEADILVVCMSKQGKPKRIPKQLLERLDKGKL